MNGLAIAIIVVARSLAPPPTARHTQPSTVDSPGPNSLMRITLRRFTLFAIAHALLVADARVREALALLSAAVV